MEPQKVGTFQSVGRRIISPLFGTSVMFGISVMNHSQKKDPPRYSLGWIVRIPLMAYRLYRHRRTDGKTTYAQCGEDILAQAILDQIGISRPVYLDVGANDPRRLSNTFYFYQQGCTGLLIEPNPKLFKRLKRVRRRDTCLLAGLSDRTETQATFYQMHPPTLSTFSRSEAAVFESEGYHIIKEMSIPLLTPSEAIERHLPRCPDFVSLDAEGLDMTILRCWDFERSRPAVFCIETLNFFEDHTKLRKDAEVIEFMEAAGYMVYADTFINTLFVDRNLWFS